MLAGNPEETVEVGEPDHARSLMGLYTEQGVVARRDRTADELIHEIREAATKRHTALLADPPTDGSAKPDRIFGGVGWDWQTLLRNRPLDLWMHEQDVRRAVGRPGGLDSPAAAHTVDYLSESLGYVLAKRVGAAPGTTVRLEVEGHEPVAYGVDEQAGAGGCQRCPTSRRSPSRRTGSPSPSSPAGGGRLRRARSASSATSSSAAGCSTSSRSLRERRSPASSEPAVGLAYP